MNRSQQAKELTPPEPLAIGDRVVVPKAFILHFGPLDRDRVHVDAGTTGRVIRIARRPGYAPSGVPLCVVIRFDSLRWRTSGMKRFTRLELRATVGAERLLKLPEGTP